MFIISLFSLALADSGQVLSEGAEGVYTGISYGQWNAFESKGATKELPATFSRMVWYSQYERGLGNNISIKFGLPIHYASMGDGAPSSDMFASTFRPGSVSASLKYSFLSEDKAPLSMAGTVNYRTGLFHTNVQSRLTNTGEGTRDLGFGLVASRGISTGFGNISVGGNAHYWLRSPVLVDLDPQYPADDLSYGLNVDVYPKSSYSVGAFIDGYSRQGGVDYPATSNIDERQQWSALNGAQTKAGLKGSMYMSKGMGVHCYGGYSISARNNPADEWIVGAGWSIYSSGK